MKAEVNGIELNYEILGQTGFPLVLIHGFGLDHSIWMDLATRYLRNYRVILPDVRGHGKSEVPMGPYPMSVLAEDIAHLLEFLGINKAIICGHSMGGYITLAFAERFSEHLGGLGFITTHAGPDSEEKRAGRFEMVQKIREKGSSALAESLAPNLTEDDEIINKVYDIIKETRPEGIIGALEGMAQRPDRTGLLSKIKVPTLVVAGEKDQIVEVDTARQMVDALSKGILLEISGAAHLPMLETPDELGKGILSLVHQVKNDSFRSEI